MKKLIVLAIICIAPSLSLAKDSSNFVLGELFLKNNGKPRTVAVVVEEGAVIHDFIASYSILDFLSMEDLKFHFVAQKKGPKTDGLGKAQFIADTTIDELPNPDILIIGGSTNMSLMKNKKFLGWLKNAYKTSEFTISICSGGLLLAASGAIPGKRAAVGIFSRKFFKKFGGVNVPDSVYVDGKLYSASGLSGGTEIAFELIEKITSRKDIAQAVNLMLEFTPELKYDTETWEKAPRRIKDIVLDINQQLGFPEP